MIGTEFPVGFTTEEIPGIRVSNRWIGLGNVGNAKKSAVPALSVLIDDDEESVATSETTSEADALTGSSSETAGLDRCSLEGKL